MANSHKRSSTPIVIKESKNKFTLRYRETVVRLTTPRVEIYKLCYKTAQRPGKWHSLLGKITKQLSPNLLLYYRIYIYIYTLLGTFSRDVCDYFHYSKLYNSAKQKINLEVSFKNEYTGLQSIMVYSPIDIGSVSVCVYAHIYVYVYMHVYIHKCAHGHIYHVLCLHKAWIVL